MSDSSKFDPLPFDLIFPNPDDTFYERLTKQEWWWWRCDSTTHNIPRLGAEYFTNPDAHPRNRSHEFFTALDEAAEWDKTRELFQFDSVFGSYLDFHILMNWGLKNGLQYYLDSPELVRSTCVVSLNSQLIPNVDSTRNLGIQPAGRDCQFPVYDCTNNEWNEPYRQLEGWKKINPCDPLNIGRKLTAKQFCKEVGCGLLSEKWLNQAVIVRCAPAETQRPEAVLRQIVQTVWDEMPRVCVHYNIPVVRQPRPSGQLSSAELMLALRDGLGDWLSQVRSHDPLNFAGMEKIAMQQGNPYAYIPRQDFDPVLNNTHETILVEMLSIGAIDHQKRCTRDSVVKRFDVANTGHAYRRSFPELKAYGYIDSALGRDGGVWLTPGGATVAKQLSKSSHD